VLVCGRQHQGQRFHCQHFQPRVENLFTTSFAVCFCCSLATAEAWLLHSTLVAWFVAVKASSLVKTNNFDPNIGYKVLQTIQLMFKPFSSYLH